MGNAERIPVKKPKFKRIFAVCVSLLLLFMILSLLIGRYPLPLKDIFAWIKSVFTGNAGTYDEATAAVILNVRLPRVLAAVFVGAMLSSAGASYQGIFRNPMVSPDILGASAGAGCGAALGILLSLPTAGIQIISFAFGLGAVFLAYLISLLAGKRENITLVLVLSGMVVSSLFSAAISIIKYIADPYSKLPEITFWLMGSLSSVKTGSLLAVAIPAGLSLIVLLLIRWRINLLAFGDEEAKAMGVNPTALRGIVIVCATMLTASAVSVSGQIGWIGLVIPHICRMITGPNYKYLLPVSLLTGGAGLLLVDNLARTMIQLEIPLSILTAIIGAPFFVSLLVRGKKGWV